MTKKAAIIKKHLIKECLLLAAGVTIVGIAAYFLDNYDGQLQSDHVAKENSVNSVRASVESLRSELENGNNQLALFNTYSLHHNSNFTLDREATTKWLVAQRDEFHLASLSISLPPFSDVPQEVVTLNSGHAIKSDVKLSISALTDNDIYAFIAKLQREMPGMVLVQELKITRSQDISAAIITELSKHHITPLVAAELSFTWIGIRFNSEKGEGNGH